MDDFYNNLSTHLMQNESNIYMQGQLFAGKGFDRIECLVLVKSLRHCGYKHQSNNGSIAVYAKELKDQRFTYRHTVEIGKIKRNGYDFGHFKYLKEEKRHTWLVGETDWSDPQRPRILTKMGWYTGD